MGSDKLDEKAGQKPAELGAMPEYRTHFELWSEPPREAVAAVAYTSREPSAPARPPRLPSYLALAGAAATGALLTFVVMLPWTSIHFPALPAQLTENPPARIAPAPAAMPTVEISSYGAAVAPRHEAAAAPLKPPVMPALASQLEPSMVPSAAPQVIAPQQPAASASMTASRIESPAAPSSAAAVAESGSEVTPPDTSADTQEEEPAEVAEDLAPAKRELLEASIRSELTRAGFASIGVSVARDGDVYLNGTFVNSADEPRVMAMVRAYDGAHDIYFSGAMWHESTSAAEQAAAPNITTSAASVASNHAAQPRTSDRPAAAELPTGTEQPAGTEPPAPAPQSGSATGSPASSN